MLYRNSSSLTRAYLCNNSHSRLWLLWLLLQSLAISILLPAPLFADATLATIEETPAYERDSTSKKLQKRLKELQGSYLQQQFANGMSLGMNPSNISLSSYIAYLMSKNNFPVEAIKEEISDEDGLLLKLKLPPWINLRFLNRRLQNTELASFVPHVQLTNDESSSLLHIQLVVGKRLCELFFEKEHPQAQIALIIDDVGYFGNGLPIYLQMNIPVTFSILPLYKSSADIASLVEQNGFEIMLHLPMESSGDHYYEYEHLIHLGQSLEDVHLHLRKTLEKFPAGMIAGINNHEGSAATENEELMTSLMQCLTNTNLYFIDSLTSPKSVAAKIAQKYKVPFSKRNYDFLDNVKNKTQIKEKISGLIKFALQHKRPAVAIIHEKQVSALAVKEMIPEFIKHNIEVITPSEIVYQQNVSVGLNN